jgi:ABC-2 type transport system ATP-binding protein
MRWLPVLFLCSVLVACGGGSDSPGVEKSTVSDDRVSATGAPPTGVPSAPAVGQSQAGRVFSVAITVPSTGDKVYFTVFEPNTITGGQTYPLVLHGHGFQGARFTSRPVSVGPIALDPTNLLGSDLTNINTFINHGYGLISIDQRGHGDSSGYNRVMDPDFEGKDDLAVLDWAEANLPWLKYGMSADGTDPHSLMVGSIGTSYGGMFQYMLYNIDPKKRLKAMVPFWSPNDILYSVAPNNTVKSIWTVALFGLGQLAGVKNATGIDPLMKTEMLSSIAQGTPDPALADMLAYHSNKYFCDGKPVATNGGPGTRPELPPVSKGGKINVLLVQGMRDTLFNLNDGYANYQCLKAKGGDVRLLTTPTGHNTAQIVPDPGQLLLNPTDLLNFGCGTVDTASAALAFFEEHLKGIAGAASAVPKQICLSIAGKDAALVDTMTVGRAGTQYAVPTTPVVAGVPEVPVAVPLGSAQWFGSEVVAGIPQIDVTVSANGPALGQGEPVLFAGIGIQHNLLLPVYELVSNQVTPLRGLGRHDVPMTGMAGRLRPGERLVLLLYGGKDQYLLSGSVGLNVAKASVMPVKVSGNVWVPRIGSPAVTK